MGYTPEPTGGLRDGSTSKIELVLLTMPKMAFPGIAVVQMKGDQPTALCSPCAPYWVQ